MSPSLRILYIAYPLLPVTEASCGGAEQALLTLEREMARRGDATVVAAAAGSRVAGELYSTGDPARLPDQLAWRDVEHNRRILQLLEADDEFDLVHDMSGTFWKHAGQTSLPVLATLHLPPVLYSREMFEHFAPNLFFNCVSESQACSFAYLPRQLGVVQNGIDLKRFPREMAGKASGKYLLWLGRICQEKAPHLALEVAERSGWPLVLAGSVYPFTYHREYCEREVAPRLKRNPRARWIKSPTFSEKLVLLQHARALVITSQIDETSSLVAMEAMACGIPVVALRRGAIPEVVADTRTGFVVESVEEMIAALARVAEIDPHVCRQRVERHFSAARMADDFERLYQRVLQAASSRQTLQAA